MASRVKVKVQPPQRQVVESLIDSPETTRFMVERADRVLTRQRSTVHVITRKLRNSLKIANVGRNRFRIGSFNDPQVDYAIYEEDLHPCIRPSIYAAKD